jgi:hypothetical protein
MGHYEVHRVGEFLDLENETKYFGAVERKYAKMGYSRLVPGYQGGLTSFPAIPRPVKGRRSIRQSNQYTRGART